MSSIIAADVTDNNLIILNNNGDFVFVDSEDNMYVNDKLIHKKVKSICKHKSTIIFTYWKHDDLFIGVINIPLFRLGKLLYYMIDKCASVDTEGEYAVLVSTDAKNNDIFCTHILDNSITVVRYSSICEYKDHYLFDVTGCYANIQVSYPLILLEVSGESYIYDIGNDYKLDQKCNIKDKDIILDPNTHTKLNVSALAYTQSYVFVLEDGYYLAKYYAIDNDHKKVALVIYHISDEYDVTVGSVIYSFRLKKISSYNTYTRLILYNKYGV